jgi:tRNA A-37 threonylcarbamoyl transferase component Bud32
MRGLFLRAVGRPGTPEPISQEQRAWFFRFAFAVAMLAIVVDLGMGLLLSRDPRIDRDVLWTFVAINLPILIVIALGTAWLVRTHAASDHALIPLIVAAQVTVIVWIQVTGTLTSYFVVAGALLAGFHRAVLSWRYGAISMSAIAAMHLGAFLLEEAGALPRAPLFLEGPGPVYGSLGMRWSVMMSLLSIYGLTWAGMNILVSTLRETEGALARAQRRLAEVAEGARHGRLTGKRLDGQWDLLEVIGRGGMGEVYRAVDDVTREEVAIKVLHPHLADDDTMLARFRREAEVASRVPGSIGPALLGVRISGPGDRYLVMEHLRGEDLAALLRRRGKLPPAEAAALIDAAAEVIGALHARGIVHRDLKPHNLFVVDATGPSLRLLDFGIARGADDAELTTAAQIIGTPGYIAPEHLHDGEHRLGPEADVYALAVIAFQLIAGQRPGVGGDTDFDLPAGLDAVFVLALARAPSDRPASVRAFADLFRAAIEGRLGDDVVRRAATVRTRGPELDDTQLAAR